MKRLIIVTAVVLALLWFGIAVAVPAPKYFVCKYVGTPGINETLQTGQNPISVSGNAITPPIIIGASFSDQQGRSLVVAQDTGQDEPSCPVPENPPVDVCSNIEGNQVDVPVGKVKKDGLCVDIPGDDTPPTDHPNPTTPQSPPVVTQVQEVIPVFVGK